MTYPTLWRANRIPSIWSDLFGARRELDRVFDTVLFGPGNDVRSMATWSPVVDVREDEDGIQVISELPGLSKDDVTVTVENGVLSIAGEKKQETEKGEKGGEYHLVERQYGRFERSFTLPRSVDAGKVKASFKEGVLSIELPKTAKAKPRQIEIK